MRGAGGSNPRPLVFSGTDALVQAAAPEPPEVERHPGEPEPGELADHVVSGGRLEEARHVGWWDLGARDAGGSPRARRWRSAASTCASRSGVIAVPYGKRDERHGLAGRSQVPSPSARLAARMSALVRPASTSGWRMPRSAAAVSPGRWSVRSSTLAPSTTTAPARRPASARQIANRLSLQK